MPHRVRSPGLPLRPLTRPANSSNSSPLPKVYALNALVRVARVTPPGRGASHLHAPSLETDALKLCWFSDCSVHHLEEPVYTVHQDCWSVARSLHPTISSLFSAAQSSRQIFPLQYSARPDVRIFFLRMAPAPVERLH